MTVPQSTSYNLRTCGLASAQAPPRVKPPELASAMHEFIAPASSAICSAAAPYWPASSAEERKSTGAGDPSTPDQLRSSPRHSVRGCPNGPLAVTCRVRCVDARDVARWAPVLSVFMSTGQSALLPAAKGHADAQLSAQPTRLKARVIQNILRFTRNRLAKSQKSLLSAFECHYVHTSWWAGTSRHVS